MQGQDRTALEILRRQYFQLVDPAQLRWADIQTLKSPDVQAWIYSHFFNPDHVTYAPPERYQLRVLKQLVGKLEAAITDPEEDEISDDLMSTFSELVTASLPSESTSAQQKAYVTYSYPLQGHDGDSTQTGSVTLLEARSVISGAGTTGLRTWEAALLMGSFLVSGKGRNLLRGRRVLELGAGTGMLSILCAKYLEMSGILATDGDEAVVDAIKTNFFLNGLTGESKSGPIVRTAALKWGRHLTQHTFAEDHGIELPDVILGADVTYDRSVIPALVATMRQFFEASPAIQVLISATIRNTDTFEAFLNACRRNQFDMELLDFALVPEPAQEGPFYPTSTPIPIWRITKAQPPEDR
ncbi:hypothetical protein M011DRAFT_255117 [Sporormia fimetaria CBS 119925]|uniref:S-adenosyl-L-methionine-dependent methyltransferase n=1 Tax=Sporormia fimetaria CBS 119925 TaxID=1340428 RepID=A0A6A6UZP1_9PLEO|nr:hypothetical protein M011DRAFT_255117 [Sporormia fimetaria CBS 119925]